jgi:tRNA(fMet)-specific endonuclease VapC
MNGYLLDTDHVSLLEHGHPQVTLRSRAVPAEQHFVSPTTIEEIFRGRLKTLSQTLSAQQRANAYRYLVNSLTVLQSLISLEYTVAMEWRYIALRKQFRRLGAHDLRIASAALETNLVLVTRNRSDFAPIPGLDLEDWSI